MNAEHDPNATIRTRTGVIDFAYYDAYARSLRAQATGCFFARLAGLLRSAVGWLRHEPSDRKGMTPAGPVGCGAPTDLLH